MPKFGYLLESGGDLVGVILLIFSSIPGQDTSKIRCNVSSWYVEPAFRSHASLLISQAIKHKNVTYVNISPAMHTQPDRRGAGLLALQQRTIRRSSRVEHEWPRRRRRR